MTDITNPLPHPFNECSTGPSLTAVGPRARAQRPPPGTSHDHVCLAFKSKLHLYPCANSFPLETSPSKHVCHLDLGVHIRGDPDTRRGLPWEMLPQALELHSGLLG